MSISELSDEDFLKRRARNRALGKIMHETRIGEVEGIGFDLRHPKVNPDEWTMDHLGGDDGLAQYRIETLPFVWFPWYGKFDQEQIETDVTEEREAVNENNKNSPPMPREVFGNITDAEYANCLKKQRKPKPLGKSWIREEIARRTPDAIVNAGDRISISRLIKYIGGDEFVHMHDRAEIDVFVKITNDSGLYKVLN